MKTYLLLVGILASCASAPDKSSSASSSSRAAKSNDTTPQNLANQKTVYFAGGCFWCLEANMDGTKGVISARSGYAGGAESSADYKTVSSGKTKHREAVKVVYDESVVSYEEILAVFWKSIDAKDAGGQYYDRGFHYTTAIYFQTEKQKAAAQASALAEAKKLGIEKAAVVIEPFVGFYDAEEYHQDYAKKNPLQYQRYKEGSRGGK